MLFGYGQKAETDCDDSDVIFFIGSLTQTVCIHFGPTFPNLCELPGEIDFTNERKNKRKNPSIQNLTQ